MRHARTVLPTDRSGSAGKARVRSAARPDCGVWIQRKTKSASHERRPCRSAAMSAVDNQPGEAFVHVILMMTVKERIAGIVGREIDLRGGVARHADRVLHDT